MADDSERLSELQPPHMLSPDGPMVRFVPWPLPKLGGHCMTASMKGFVGNERFARPGDEVIKRTNRQTTKKWRELDG
jgi:hypothetical protein